MAGAYWALEVDRELLGWAGGKECEQRANWDTATLPAINE